MVLRKTLLSCAALTLLTGMALSNAHAQPPTQLSFIGGIFDFTSGSGLTNAGGSGGTTTTFSFANNAGSTVTFNGVSAYIVLSGSLSGSATEVSVGGSNIVQQNLTGVTETIVANGSGGFAAGTTLLSVNASSALLSGSGNSLTFSLGGTDLFSSNYFDVHGIDNQTMLLTTNSALGLSSVTSSNTVGNITVSTGTLGSFDASASSNVFNSTAVPEASTLMGLGGLVLGGGFFGLRRRKA